MNAGQIKAIDLFAGIGGFTEGATQAGLDVVWAANHWPAAVAAHSQNHPAAQHACQDLQQADWTQVPSFDWLLASPACQGHTAARGKERPHHDATRSTAWAVIDAMECHRPAVAIIENVPEFAKWVLFPAWRLAVEALGYSLTLVISDAANHGVPQERLRLFIIATRSRHPVDIKLPVHAPVGFDKIADWQHPRWSLVRKPGRAVATLSRVAAGRAKFGSRFVMPYYGSGSGLTGRDINRPIGTITCKERWALVDGDRMRMIHAGECRAAMGFRADYKLPAPDGMTADQINKLRIFMLGNAVCPPQVTDIINAVKVAA